jgi:hypothetical protein
MTTEETLAGWTGPSSATEQDRQDRTERMVREAVSQHPGFTNCGLSVYAKGSYANNTNVRSDSDVDIAVQCHEAMYWDEEVEGAHGPGITAYTGPWTPEKLRSELIAALQAKFPNQVDTSGSTAIQVHSGTSRVDADVVPCFDFRYFFANGGSRDGALSVRTSGSRVENFPVQHLAKGKAKNVASNSNFKKSVRILKRVENKMVQEGIHREVPSYLVECLVYNCPSSVFSNSTWTGIVQAALVHIWNGLQGTEPDDVGLRWLEVNECKWLFDGTQKWTRTDAREFAYAAWNYLGFAE